MGISLFFRQQIFTQFDIFDKQLTHIVLLASPVSEEGEGRKGAGRKFVTCYLQVKHFSTSTLSLLLSQGMKCRERQIRMNCGLNV